MKKFVSLSVLFVLFTLSVAAQGFYFDIGLGFGKSQTKVDGIDMVDAFKDAGVSVNEMGIDLGLKAGFGPFGNIPLYVIGELGGIGHRIYDKYNYLQFNSYILGPGVIFYPIQLVQLGFSAGYSYVSNQTDIPGRYMYDSKGGFAWNISAAIDLGKGNHGCLIGVKYFHASNTLKITNVNESASILGIFVKYTYRRKTPSL